MFIVVILAYGIIAYIDLKATFYKAGKNKLTLYFTLMAISCGIGIASLYIDKMPSPAHPIKNVVFTLLGK